jgi:hypothetical protein
MCEERLEIKLIRWALLSDAWKDDDLFLEILELVWGDDQPNLSIKDSLESILQHKRPKPTQEAIHQLVASYKDPDLLFGALNAQNKTDPKGWV